MRVSCVRGITRCVAQACPRRDARHAARSGGRRSGSQRSPRHGWQRGRREEAARAGRGRGSAGRLVVCARAHTYHTARQRVSTRQAGQLRVMMRIDNSAPSMAERRSRPRPSAAPTLADTWCFSSSSRAFWSAAHRVTKLGRECFATSASAYRVHGVLRAGLGFVGQVVLLLHLHSLRAAAQQRRVSTWQQVRRNTLESLRAAHLGRDGARGGGGAAADVVRLIKLCASKQAGENEDRQHRHANGLRM